MPRRVEPWNGKTDDTPIPERVKDRIIRVANNLCYRCGLRVRIGNGEVDHIIAIINGGANAEGNLCYVHKHCHQDKTREDVAQKSSDYKTRRSLYGFGKPKRPFQKREKLKPTPGRWVGYDFDLDGIPKRSRWVRPDED
jgi:5-methylcytosine-specific restriction protein A